MSRRPIVLPAHSPPSRRQEKSRPSPTPGSIYNGFDPHNVSGSMSMTPGSSSRYARNQTKHPSGFVSRTSKRDDGYAQEEEKKERDAYSQSQGAALQFRPSFESQHPLHSSSWEEKKDPASDTPSPRCTPSPPSSLVNLGRRGGSRIARLSSMFGGGNSKKEAAALPVAERSFYLRQPHPLQPAVVAAPPSPPQSSSSGGYVGWPGTLDSHGQTVVVHSSYEEESSVGQSQSQHNMDSSYEPADDDVTEHQYHANTSSRRDAELWPETTKYHPTMKLSKAAIDVSFDSVTTASTSFSKSPARTTPVETRFRNNEPRQQQREKYDELYDLAEAITGTAARSHQSQKQLQQFTSPPSFLNHSMARDYAQTEIGHRLPQGRVNVRSLIQRRQAAEPQGIMFTGTANEEQELDASWNSRRQSASDPTAPVVPTPPSASLFKNTSIYSKRVDHDAYDTRSERHADETRIVAPTREALAANDQKSPPLRTFSNSQGFRGLMDKTRDVPCLMDDADSESMNSSKAPSTFSSMNHSSSNPDPPARSFGDFGMSPRRLVAFGEQDTFHEQQSGDDDSDVFDGVSARESDVFDDLSHLDARSRSSLSPRRSARSRGSYPESIAEEEDEDVQIVLLGGGLTAIQTNKKDFADRKTASDYDDNLTNSDIDQFGFAATPAFEKMVVAGLKQSSSLLGIQTNFGSPAEDKRELGSSGSAASLFADPYDHDRASPYYGGLSEYAIDPEHMKLLVRTYRKFSDKVNMSITLEEFEKEEDEHRAFALFEMRSRIMEKDIERGLERRGGTAVADDSVLTEYNRTAHRIRDAVIVSKAWRDGASPKDVITAAMLTRRHDHTYYIRRPSHRVNESVLSQGNFFPSSSSQDWWEPVEWMDDTSFAQFRCPSLGFRHMRGVELFTIGDCQSMLLKLTNERCVELRLELNDATRRQLEAEEQLAAEGDAEDGMMTDAEVAYLGSMEEVKTISKDLVQAEQSFKLVRERIEKLVHKYEQLLNKIDTESFAGASSIMTYESSYVSEHDSAYWHAMEERERAVWARRAQRAEVKAQIAAREALLLKQQARMFQEQKQRELEELQQRLNELQSESSYSPVDRAHTAKLAQSFAMHRHDEIDEDDAEAAEEHEVRDDRGNLDEVKRRFRDRMKTRMQQNGQASVPASSRRCAHTAGPVKRPLDPALRDLFRSAGEEMCQQLDFYERSLRAVATDPSS